MFDLWDVAEFALDCLDLFDVLDLFDLDIHRDDEQPQLAITRRPWWPPDTSASGPPKQD